MRLAALCLATALVLLNTGCRRRSATPPAPAPEAAPAGAAPTPVTAAGSVAVTPETQAAKAAPPAGAIGADRIEDTLPTAPPHSSKSAPVDRKLTEALQRFNEATGKMPSSFQALVAAKYLTAMPTPPAGKRYALDRPHMQVVIID